jgi:hypothetical protein
LEEAKNKRNILQHTKGTYVKLLSNSTKWGKSETIFSKSETKQSCPTLIQYSASIPSQRSNTRDMNKKDTNRKGRSQITHIFR